MKCNKCGQEVPAGSKFCFNCGNKMEKLCPQCQQPLPENARFCMNCGANLTGASSTSAVMKDNVIAGDVNQTVNNYVKNNTDNSVHNTSIDQSVHSSVDQSVHTSVVNVYNGVQDTETTQEKELRKQLEAADYSFTTERDNGRTVSVLTKASNLKSSNLFIPSKDWQGHPVVRIGVSAFDRNSKITGVIIPKGVRSIGYHAFFYCKGLTSVSLPDGLKDIEAGAFDQSGVHSITIPRSVQLIEKLALSSCSSIYYEGTIAEWNAIKREVELFNDCPAITAHCLDGDAVLRKECPKCKKMNDAREYWCYHCHEKLSNPLASETLRRTTAETQAHQADIRRQEEVRKAEEARKAEEKRKAEEARLAQEAQERLIANRHAFETADFDIKSTPYFPGCIYTKGTLQKVTKIHNEHVIIPSCDLQGKPVSEIGNYAFEGCNNLRSVTVSEGIRDIQTGAFAQCSNLQSITIPDSLEYIAANAFRGCARLTSLSLPASFIEIGAYAFYQCTALNTVTFRGTFKQWVIPNLQWASMHTIYKFSFSGCTNLKSITIPPYLQTIEEGAFQGCTALTNISFCGTMAAWKAIKFGKNWNQGVPATKVICSDGTVYLR